MKELDTKLKIFAVYFLIGAFLIFLSFIAADRLGDRTGILSAMGAALAAVGAVRFFQYRKLRSDPERAEEWSSAMHEERTAFIANKARAWTFFISIFVELAVGLAAWLAFGQELLGMALMYIVCFQGVLSFILYRVFNKKY
jgi:uncharacterized membrane protein